MFVKTLTPDIATGNARYLLYDADGYSVLSGSCVISSVRLPPICYLLEPHDRANVARRHGLEDAGEYGLAESTRHQAHGETGI